METLAALGHGFAVALTPINLFWSRARASPSARPSACCPASARRSPWRCCCPSPPSSIPPPPSSCSPASTTAPCTAARPPRSCSTRRAKRLDRHRHRRQHDGAQGPRRAGPGDGRDRLVRRRHDRHPGADLRRPAPGQAGAAVRPGRVFRAHGAGADHGHGGARRQPGARSGEPVHRPGAGAGRHRPADRPGAVHPGRPRAAGRHRHGGSGGGPVRGRRDALRRRAPPFEKEEIYALKRLDVDEQGGLGAFLEALAARHRFWAFRSAPCRPAAARSRPSSPT